MQIFDNTNFDFLKWRWHAIALSSLVILAGIAMMVTRGMPLGIDFSGGTVVIVRFQQSTGEDRVRAALDPLPGEKVVQEYGDPAQNEIMIRLPQAVQEQGTALENASLQVVDVLKKGSLGQFDVISTEIVGPVIGAELQRKGIYATLASMVGILAYIALRFRFSFGVGAIVAVFHDVLVTVAFLTFFGYELSLNVVAALLTMTGYSVNDTIVIFDRVRENTRSQRRDSLADVVNRSVNQTLGRTIITAGATALSVLALYLFGGEVLRGFAFTMLVGIVTGTYSTVFIAAAVAILMSRAKIGAATSAPAAKVELTSSRKARKAKAS
ncbi:MAG: protein translocase subunit SecF [Vicinamibacterales bacterium]